MTPGAKTDRRKLIQDIFQAAIKITSSERSEYLDRVCAGDEELRSEVASLLENDSVDTDTLHSVVASDLKGLAEAAGRREIGLRVGPYRLVRELDGGGMESSTLPSIKGGAIIDHETPDKRRFAAARE
jgi:serine/threonine-protein kinase